MNDSQHEIKELITFVSLQTTQLKYPNKYPKENMNFLNTWQYHCFSRDRSMYWQVVIILVIIFSPGMMTDEPVIQVFDMTYSTTWRDMTNYYDALERRWKICYNCGIPGLGTGMHMEYSGAKESVQPAFIPAEYLLTRLVIIDVTSLTKKEPALSLTLETAQQWISIKQDPTEPTLLMFKFGWIEKSDFNRRHKCICQIPGLSYELAQWIAANLSHVVGVGTDAPSLESEQTRELTTRTVSNVLGKSGIYMVENVDLRRKIPESGCMAIAMPLKMLTAGYVPTRLLSFCAPRGSQRVVLAPRGSERASRVQRPTRDHARGRGDPVHLDEILAS